MRFRRKRAELGAFALAFGVSTAEADLDVARVVQSLNRAGTTLDTLPKTLLGRGADRISLLVERSDPSAALPPGAEPIQGNWFALDAARADVTALAERTGLSLHWAPARRLLIDRALGWSRVAEFRKRSTSGGTGKGVVVGLVDTGVDPFHPDFQNPDGTTRIKWLIDFTRPPAGLQPALESEYGCTDSAACAIYSGTDIDALVANAIVGDEPRDMLGHGSHVASLAAGNGRASDPTAFAGVAPEASLIVARLSGGELIFDDLVARGARFVFERASALNQPAVLNLSLGSDLGAHDGSSALERALSAFVGPDQPGRAIVVAAGNSAGLSATPIPPFPAPFGIHTEVHVPRESPTWVPLLTPYQDAPLTNAGIKVWISTRAGDELEVGFERGGKLLGKLTPPGGYASQTSDGVRVLILNGVGTVLGDRVSSQACLVMVEGEWPAGETFGLRFGGHGSASLWVAGEGDLDPSFSLGPLFPRATKQGTIAIPASAPGLIAVGALMNRTDWTDWQGATVSHPENGALDSPADSIAYFSAAGPSASGVLKPDLVAPGMNLVGAMAATADPRNDLNFSMFSGRGYCAAERECRVVDDFHAVTSGTSMAAPIVAGAIALLFERDPSLTQGQVRALLQAGARSLSGTVPVAQQASVGALDLDAALAAQLALDSPLAAVPSTKSWLTFANSYAHPDPEWPLEGYAELRDLDGKLADAIDPRELTLRVDGARLSEPLTRVAPAYYRFAISAPAASGGGNLRVALEYRAALLAEKTIPIAVDASAASGVPAPRGGCSVARSSVAGRPLHDLLLLGLLALMFGVHAARRASAA